MPSRAFLKCCCELLTIILRAPSPSFEAVFASTLHAGTKRQRCILLCVIDAFGGMQACDEFGNSRQSGADRFHVEVRGVAADAVSVVDRGDGTYKVQSELLLYSNTATDSDLSSLHLPVRGKVRCERIEPCHMSFINRDLIAMAVLYFAGGLLRARRGHLHAHGDTGRTPHPWLPHVPHRLPVRNGLLLPCLLLVHMGQMVLFLPPACGRAVSTRWAIWFKPGHFAAVPMLGRYGCQVLSTREICAGQQGAQGASFDI